MDEAAIYAALTELFHDMFADNTIVLRPETSAPDVKGWNSITNLTLIVAVEGRFGIRMQSAEIEQLENVGDLVATITRKLQA